MLQLEIRRQGAAPAEVVEVVGEITQADLVVANGPRLAQTSTLKRISDRHHALARAVASGMQDVQLATMFGYDPARISMLKADPTFAELVRGYAAGEIAEMRGIHERLVGISKLALDELETRLEDKPEDLSVGQLLEVGKFGADRIGFGPQATNVSVNIHTNLADKLRAARERAAAASQIDITPARTEDE